MMSSKTKFPVAQLGTHQSTHYVVRRYSLKSYNSGIIFKLFNETEIVLFESDLDLIARTISDWKNRKLMMDEVGK